MTYLRPLFMAVIAGVVVSFAVGCRSDDEIKHETITHADRQPMRLRAAMIEQGKLVWVFLLKGPEAEVDKHAEAFNAFVRSARFPEKKEPITLTEPKEWKKDPPSEKPERFAAYRIEASPKDLEVTVTMFPAEKFRELDNVRRWQGQVLQEPIEEARRLDEVIQREKVEKHEVRWVDLKGLGVHLPSRPPDPLAQANQKKFNMPFEVKQGPKGEAKLPFRFELPKGWKKGELRGTFMVERFELGDGVEVTLTPLRGNGGGLAANVNRWRKEVELPGLGANEVEDSGKWIDIAGKQSFYVDIANPKGPAGKNRSVALILPLGAETWFVKMHGEVAAVGQHKKAFETFIQSFKLEPR